MRKKSTGAFIVCNKKLLLFLRDDKPNISSPNYWSLVGGNLDHGESFEQAIKREIFEEISIEVDSLGEIGKVALPKEDYFLYFVEISEENKNKIKLGNEGQMVKFFSFNEIGELKLVKGLKWCFDKFSDNTKELIENGEIDKEGLGFNKSGEIFLD